jgi:sigma-B regulation protein RsbU (phosphoserine phosphatase)
VGKTTDTQPLDRPTFLVVDDDAMVRKLVSSGLQALQPGQVFEVENGLQAQKVLSEHAVDVVVTDVLMPQMDGRELMQWAQAHCPGPLWIVLSGLDTFDAAVDALHLGAFDFLPKPPEVQRVRVAVRNAIDQINLKRERERLHEELEQSNILLAEKVDQLEALCGMLQEQADVIQGDLKRAEVIQRALLPRVPPRLDGWSVQTLYRTGSSVGGDFYDIVPLDRRHVGLVIADAAGHGVAAAMLSVLFKHHLRMWDEESRRPLPPRTVFEDLNRDLRAHVTGPGIFVTAIYALLDVKSGRMRLVSAGHPPAILNQATGGTKRLERSGPALGLQDDARYQEIKVDVESGDSLLLYTDGLVEDGSLATQYDDLEKTLVAGGNAGDTVRRLYADVAGMGGDRDDVTIVLLERAGGLSQYDDVPEPDRPQTQPEPIEAQAEIKQGVADRKAYLCVAGKGTWMRSQSFFDAAEAMLKRYKSLTIDLGACEHLDSTFLGTVHEVVMSAPEAVRVQRVTPPVRALFEELDMQGVLNHTSLTFEPLPEKMTPLKRADTDAEQQGQRMLRAHEILASLSDENREQFRDVVDSLREELGVRG